MSPKDDQPLLSSLDVPAPRKRGRKPGQKSTKASELSDQDLVQKVLKLGKRAGRSPEELVVLLNAYLERYQQILNLRRQADEMERQLLIGDMMNGSHDLSQSQEDEEEDEENGEETDPDESEDEDES